MEKFLEKAIFASRWILAPIYMGLSIALLAIGVKFFQEAFHVLSHVMSMAEADLILAALAMIDMVLVAGLVIMVMFAGYENFVSRIDVAEHDDNLGWLGKLDSGTLKLKVAASIVAISSIHLLRKFMEMGNPDSGITTELMTMYVVVHLTFVVSALLMGVLDKISFDKHRDH